MDLFFDSIFQGLFDRLDPLGMILRTLMALLSDGLAKAITGVYAGLFEITTVDFSIDAVKSIWLITTGVSVSLATVMLIIAGFRSVLAQNTGYLFAALPGVVMAVLGPQALSVFLPLLAAGLTDLAQAIIGAASPDLAASMRLLAGIGTNPIYEGMGLLAPLIAGVLLWGLTSVFFVLLFCMAGAVVLFVLSPFACVGLVMKPTRAWFITWARTMFALLFAKVPIAILLALSVALFANSRFAGMTQSFVNAGAGIILGVGALLAPLLGFGLFAFMGTIITRPPVPSTSPSRAAGTAYYGSQMARSAVNGMRTAASKFTDRTKTTTTGSRTPAPVEPSAAERAHGAHVTAGASSPAGVPVPPPMGRPTSSTPAASPAPVPVGAGVGTSSGASASAGAAAGASTGAATAAGPAAPVVLGAEATKQTINGVRASTEAAAQSLATPADPATSSGDAPSIAPPSARD